MTRPNDFFVNNAASAAAQEFGQTHGGRIFAGLHEASPERTELSKMLISVLMQDHDIRFREFLAGETNEEATAPTTVVSDEARPVYTRPNGKPYYARKWNTFWDVDVLKEARPLLKFPLLHGPPGTGKTAMAESAFGEELITSIISAETTKGELYGSYVPDGSSGYVWVDGPLLTAVKEGRPILLDEILLGDPKVLSVLYPLMDGRGFLDVDANPQIGITPAKEGFFVIGSGNPNVPGAKISPALASRFPLQVEVTTDWKLAEKLGADKNVVTFCSSLATRASGTNPSLSWAPQFRELLDFADIAKQWGEHFAVENLLRLCPRRDLDEVRKLARTAWPTLDLKAAQI